MSRSYRFYLLGLLALTIMMVGLAGCKSDTEAPGKNDKADIKGKREDKKGD